MCNIDENIIKFFTKYIDRLNENIKLNNVGLHDAVWSNMIISEYYEYYEDKQKLDDMIFYNMKLIKNHIIDNTLNDNISLFGGLSEVALSIYAINYKTKQYDIFLKKVNIMLSNLIIDKINYYKIKKNLNEEYYDAISGISGVLSYILLLDDFKELKECCLSFLINICKEKVVDGIRIPGWSICNSQLDLEYKDKYTSGYINFSVSHGCGGVLAVLSKSYKQGIIVPGQKEIIEYILNMYDKMIISDANSFEWTKVSSIDNFTNLNKLSERSREGWCYGDISISKSILLAAEITNNHKIGCIAYNIILNKINNKLEDMYIISPTLCHGYSGIFYMLSNIAYLEKDAIKASNLLSSIKDIIYNMFDEDSKYGFFDIEENFYSGQYNLSYEDSCKFLTGASGVLLALISEYNDNYLLNTHLLI